MKYRREDIILQNKMENEHGPVIVIAVYSGISKYGVECSCGCGLRAVMDANYVESTTTLLDSLSKS